MATRTIISPPKPARNAPPVATKSPQLKSLVYSKYRELLGSYNGKANEILQSYPAYMVQEDKGFDFVDNYCGGPPQSTIASSARRLQSQLPAEPPACVQNAMMRRDKQPFTYTPGGLDLSQIKSPRMAKRISRNAQSEGVANQPKISPLAQNNSSNGQSPVSPAASLGAAAMGMPFQVFPTGPPAPPPPPPPSVAKKPATGPTNNGNSAPMPPPPPPPFSSAEQKTPRPHHSFEPPPMGCRPKIAIPPNPMANLKKAPRPQPKNDFWIEEYRNEKRQQVPDRPSQQSMYNSRQADNEVAQNSQNRTDELTVRNESPKKRSPSPSNLTESYGNGSRLSSIKTPPVYSQSPVPPNLPPPITPTKVSRTPSDTSTAPVTPIESNQDHSSKPRQSTPSPSTTSSTINRATTPVSNSTSTNGNGTASVKPPTPQKPPPQALGSLYIPPAHEVFANSKQTLLNQTSPPWMSSRQNSVKEQPEWVHKEESELLEANPSKSNINNESSAKAPEPLVVAPQPSPPKPVVVQQQSPAPPSAQQTSRSQTVEAPPSQPIVSQTTHYIQLQNPINKMTIPTVIQQQPPPASIPANRGYPQQTPIYVQNQMYSPQPTVSQKERVIPIQIEQSPIKAPSAAPSFAPPPYYSPGPQFNNVQSPITVGYPHSGYSTPTAMFTNPNHFVNQGYNNISYPPTSPQHTVYQQPQHHPHYSPAPTSQLQQQQHAHAMQQQRMQQQTPTQQQPQHQQQQSAGGVRIIPIKVEGNGDTATTVRGPLSQTPAIIQSGDHRYVIHDIPLEAKLRFLKNRLSDPRSSKNQQAWNGNVTPNQSRSFRVLQHITDTLDPNEVAEAGSNSSTPKPTAADADHQQQSADSSSEAGPDAQLRRMQLSSEDKALMNRVKTQVDGEVFLHKEEDPRYRGAAIPSKAFRYLQNLTEGAGQAAQGNNPTGSANRANQMFTQNRGNYSESDDSSAANQPYIPPSEQRVEEPKKYTGSAIPSRSFKMLQAMTDAPADTNSSDIEGNQNLPCNGEVRYSPFPYPPTPHYCCNPNWHFYDPNTPQYYPHHPPPTHHTPGFYYPPHPPPPPPPQPPHGHYDRSAYYAGYMSPHHFYYPQEPCSPCTPPPYYQVNQPQVAYCENIVPDTPTHSYIITTPNPRIVVTPTIDDSDIESIISDFNTTAHPLTRSQSSLKRLSERLASYNTSPEKIFPTDLDPQIRCSPCSPLNERYRTFEESTSSAPSSQSECSDSEGEGSHVNTSTSPTQKKSPETVSSVQENPTDRDEASSSEESEEEETVGYENNTPEHLPHQLSVIFEEDSVYASANPSRRDSVCSNSSTISDCSSTLANDLDGYEKEDRIESNCGNHTDDDIDRLEDDDDSCKSQITSKAVGEKPESEGSETETEEDEGKTESEEDTSDCEEQSRQNDSKQKNGNESSKTNKVCDSETETDSSDSEADVEECDTKDRVTDTDVTVTITIPSIANKSTSEEIFKSSKKEDTIPAFTVDYEEDSHVSVSVSLPLKTKSELTNEAVDNECEKSSNKNMTPENGQDEDEEVDFWSQIGEEEEYHPPSRSLSRDFYSSREVSVDRDSVLNQEDDHTHQLDGDIEFWNNENGPTEAIDLWKPDRLIENFIESQKNGSNKDSIDYWQTQNERMVNNLFSDQKQSVEIRSDGCVKDENNNSNKWQTQTNNVEQPKLNEQKVDESGDESDTESSDEESEDDSEDYETTNTSKEESDVEESIPTQTSKLLTNGTEMSKVPEKETKLSSSMQQLNNKTSEILNGTSTATVDNDKTLTVRDRISLFETNTTSPLLEVPKRSKTRDENSTSRPSSMLKLSCDESEAEDDSGVTSDMSKHISEVETDSECFPEMRKMTRYQRAATHSRLFKLLQDESNNGDSDEEEINKLSSVEPPKDQSENGTKFEDRKELTLVENSTATNTAFDRRDRLTLPIRHQSSSGVESLSSSTSSASPVSGVTNDKLAEELVQSLLMKKKGRLFRNLPLEKLHAAALKILQEDLESNGTLSSTEDNLATVDSTPALTPQEFKSEYHNSYSDYYDTWNDTNGKSSPLEYIGITSESVPSKTFRSLHDNPVSNSNRKTTNWSTRCPRVLSNKSISRLAEVRESETPDPIPRSRPPSRASNQSPFAQLSGMSGDPGSRNAYKQFRTNH
ncbi:uncharacterized protein LOC129749858 isoform X2 [Uranotaenia lowii]|uniref:uncharacterized protein LOC129749858 isoform X2 n=1 Tax=Uranotaenia lowii TaxID=190385 RepID=UPI002478ABA2|nr:uncharacterized protein LOC129749858 isoform X2 [Uranotaenia lowii]